MMQPEYFIERKKIKKQLSMWKLAAVGLMAIVMTLVLGSFSKKSSKISDFIKSEPTDYIASVYIDGMIVDDKKRDAKILKICDDEKIKALIIYINSPGGTVGASESLYNAFKKISLKKPTVAVMQTMAASGGYLASLGADHIIALNSTMTGSLGVLFQNFEITNLADKIGITLYSFKSNPLKAAPNMMEKITPQVEEAAMSMIKDCYNYFVETIAERRKLPKEYVMQIADGRVYTGRQAFELKLVDKIGGLDEALKWLHEEKKVDENLEVYEYKLKSKTLLQEILGQEIEQKIRGLFSMNTGLVLAQ